MQTLTTACGPWLHLHIKPRELGSPWQRAAGCAGPVSGFWSWHWGDGGTHRVSAIFCVASVFNFCNVAPIVWGLCFQLRYAFPCGRASAKSADAKHVKPLGVSISPVHSAISFSKSAGSRINLVLEVVLVFALRLSEVSSSICGSQCFGGMPGSWALDMATRNPGEKGCLEQCSFTNDVHTLTSKITTS